jgi:uncharacterized protein YndB with AHSA1/START domain
MEAAIPGMAEFDDRWTVRYVRLLPAPMVRVWEAVTSSEQLDVWFVPVSRVEPELGGRCSFSWGRPESEAETWTVTEFRPKRILQMSREPDHFQFLRFELEPVDGATRLTFVNRFARETSAEDLARARANPGNKLLALPAGTDTPIRAGILEGYHLIFDELGRFLATAWRPDALREASARNVATANTLGPAGFGDDPQREPSALAAAYYDHIRDHCPAA